MIFYFFSLIGIVFFVLCLFSVVESSESLSLCGFFATTVAQQPAGVFVVVGVGFGKGTMAPRPPLMGLK